jgi:hypothetical protein
VSLLIHASVQISGDPAQLASFRELFNASLAADYVGLVCTEQHAEASLHYDLKTAQGIPFPAFVAVSEALPDLRVAIEWVNVDAGSRGAATIQAGRIVDQSSDPLGGVDALPIFVSANGDGSLQLALVLLAFRSDTRIGYAISGERDALFQLRFEPDDSAKLYFVEGDLPQWDACMQIDLASNSAQPLVPWTALPIERDQYAQWRSQAEAFVREWLWLDGDTAEATAVERERFSQMSLPVQPANLRYQKLKLLRERAAQPEFSTLADEDKQIAQLVLGCLLVG